MSYWNKQ